MAVVETNKHKNGLHKYTVQEAQNAKVGQAGYKYIDAAGTANTGTAMTVSDASNLEVGGALISINLYSTNNIITAISGNNITLTTSATWTNTDPLVFSIPLDIPLAPNLAAPFAPRERGPANMPGANPTK